jgi:hypothetical protein
VLDKVFSRPSQDSLAAGRAKKPHIFCDLRMHEFDLLVSSLSGIFTPVYGRHPSDDQLFYFSSIFTRKARF